MPNQSLIKRILSDVQEAVELQELSGFCLACGEQSDDYCEPDAEGYPCAACGEAQVMGAENILIMYL